MASPCLTRQRRRASTFPRSAITRAFRHMPRAGCASWRSRAIPTRSPPAAHWRKTAMSSQPTARLCRPSASAMRNGFWPGIPKTACGARWTVFANSSGWCAKSRWEDRWPGLPAAPGDCAEDLPSDHSSPSIWRDPQKCIECGLCADVCGASVQIQNVIGFADRGGGRRPVPRLRPAAERHELHLLRPVHAGLPGRRHHRGAALA